MGRVAAHLLSSLTRAKLRLPSGMPCFRQDLSAILSVSQCHIPGKRSWRAGGRAVKPVVATAAQAMETWLKASEITSGPLFRRINKAGRLGEDALTGTAIRDIVKARCTLAGVGDDFSAHSLRSGFVTEAGRQNMPLQETMAMTGHRSMDVVTGYFRAGAAQVSAVARMMDSGKPIPDAV